MQELHIGDGDMLALHVRDMSARRAPQAGQQQSARQPAAQQQRGRTQPDPETLRLQILGDPLLRENIQRTHPDLAAVLDNSAVFAQTLQNRYEEDRRQQAHVAEEIARLNADPFDLDAQLRIEEMIREQAVQDNLQIAIEHNPEGRSCL